MFCGHEAGVVVARLFCFIVQITQRERFSSFLRVNSLGVNKSDYLKE